MNIEKYINKLIVHANITREELILQFEDGSRISIFDGGQSCCECRYMTTDDNPESLVGGTLLHIDEREGPEVEMEHDEVHEQSFVEVGTDKGFITLVTHNQHNGYYGGFDVVILDL